jgi:hypothetical protein
MNSANSEDPSEIVCKRIKFATDEETGLREFVADQGPFDYYNFGQVDLGSMIISAGVVAIGSFGGPVKFQMNVRSKNCYTHTRNREKWTGPIWKVRAFDAAGLLLLDWEVGRVNVLCKSDYFVLKDTQINSDGTSEVVVSHSAHDFWHC